MSHITVNDLLLVLDDLFGPKRALMEPTLSFRIFGPTLEQQKGVLDDVRAALKKKPLTEELAAADEEHDTSARAIFYIAEGLLGWLSSPI